MKKPQTWVLIASSWSSSYSHCPSCCYLASEIFEAAAVAAHEFSNACAKLSLLLFTSDEVKTETPVVDGVAAMKQMDGMGAGFDLDLDVGWGDGLHRLSLC